MPSRIAKPDLKQLVDTKIAKKKITPDDAREVLGVVRDDKKFSASEVAQLKRLAALPASKFEKRDEFIPNPYDAEDGVTVKADPKKWIESTLRLATATLTVKSTVDEVKVTLGKPKEFEVEDFGPHLSRVLTVSYKGKEIEKAGTIEFAYGGRNVKVAVAAGASIDSVNQKIETALMRAEGGSLTVMGHVDASKSRNSVQFEVL